MRGVSVASFGSRSSYCVPRLYLLLMSPASEAPTGMLTFCENEVYLKVSELQDPSIDQPWTGCASNSTSTPLISALPTFNGSAHGGPGSFGHCSSVVWMSLYLSTN